MAVRRRSSGIVPTGQHFLRSSRLAAALVADAEIRASELVLEIGAGTGVLTRALAATGATVVAVERDPALATLVERRFHASANVTVRRRDALECEWPPPPYVVVSNLPFARSTEILGALLDDPPRGPARADVIVQWELAAKRAAVRPSTLRGVYWSASYALSVGRYLAPSAFSPPPSVAAAVLRIRLRSRPLVAPDELEAYRRFLAACFVDRPLRRAVAPFLSSLELKRLAPVLAFTAEARPRELDAHQWAGLFAAAAPRLQR